jgi:two-component system NtrC family sensor kinase
MSNAIYFLKMVHADSDETTKEYLDMIKHEIDNSQRIITDLLDFARTKTPLTKTTSVSELLDGTIGKCVIPHTVNLQTDLPDTLPLLRIDPLQMGQVFQNLITNAIQAMPGGGELRISARKVQEARNDERGNNELHLGPRTPILVPGFIEISVTDTGEGISQENMNKLFQPLFTTKAKGIGLGLVVCRNLVDANGGKIEVESQVGTGTTFMVKLPADDTERSQA